MNDYYELRIDIDNASEDATDLLAGMLADEAYESFVPDASGLTAYVPSALFSAEAVERVLADFPLGPVAAVSHKLVEGRDWNQEWERNYFKPIVIAGRCVVHSSFHTDVPRAEYDIVIDPKMAFGTGHHATTTLILTRLLQMDLKGKSLIDMGTGTGILAILAAMRGAAPVTGIEIDSFAYANAIDNIALNSQQHIKLINGDASALADVAPADVFVANINRNVITADIAAYAERLRHGGMMLLSGFYEHDIPVVLEAAAPYGLTEAARSVSPDGDPWSCLVLTQA